jgi:PHP family Zn ribbon phosphoesterase
MAASLAHAHRIPHTVKQPARCPHCGSTRLIRKGTRRKKLEIAQLWQQRMPPRLGVADRMPHFMGRIMGAETLVTSGKFSLLYKSES